MYYKLSHKNTKWYIAENKLRNQTRDFHKNEI